MTSEHDLLSRHAGETLYRVDKGNGAYYNQYDLPSPQTALVIDGADMLVASADGKVRRVNPETGAISATYNAPVNIQAMVKITATSCAADFDGDGSLSIDDFIAFQMAFAFQDFGGISMAMASSHRDTKCAEPHSVRAAVTHQPDGSPSTPDGPPVRFRSRVRIHQSSGASHA